MPSFSQFKAGYKPKTGANSSPTKKKGSVGGPSSSLAAPSTATRYGDTIGSVNSKATPSMPSIVPSPVSGSGGQANSLASAGNSGYGGVSAASTGGGGSGAVSGLPTRGTNPVSGFAANYSPGALQEQVWRDPQMILNTMFQQSGQNTASPMYSTLRDFYGADPQSLWLMMNGGKGATTDSLGGAPEYANFLNQLYSNYMTPGGRGVDFGEILGQLGNLTDQSGMSPQDQSPLWQMLTSGGASDQARTMYGLLGDAAKTSLSPAVASAFMDALARQSDSYLTSNASTQGGADPFYQYFSNPMQGR